MKNKKQLISTIIFFGGLWGIVEATIGYVLHIIPGLSLYMSGAVLFAFATFILYKAYAITNSRTSLLLIGGVAAAIKSVNFFLPLFSPFKVINPMLSIIMESLMVVAVISLLNKKSVTQKISGLLIASVGWRLLFFAYTGYQYITTGYVYLENITQYLQFFGLYAVGSAILALGIIYLDKAVMTNKSTKININPVVSMASLIIAIVLTILL